MKLSPIIILITTLLLSACREEVYVVPADFVQVCTPSSADDPVNTMYLINEGNMGSNKASIDMLDYSTGVYWRNLYASRNPSVVKELGDVANDAKIYGNRLYVTVNCSHKVEVMDAHTLQRIGQVDIPNCRYIAFHEGHAYVSSYVSTNIGDANAPFGEICEVDTATLSITRRVTVGYQPEEMAVLDDHLYVANSGGYRPPQYDNIISVINLTTMTREQDIKVDINLFRLRIDPHGTMWVTSRGDHKSRPGALYRLDKLSPQTPMQITDRYDIPVSNMAFRGDSLIYIASQWNDISATSSATYGIINTSTGRIIANDLGNPAVTASIIHPYCIAVHPYTGDIYLTDARNYVSSGSLYCLDPYGNLKWSTLTGDIPAAITFLCR